MKIKEVQISNFRAFQDVKSSTFNFIYNKNEISDLISIYAPNGFGKTSFYDAVEWGITGKIERFDLVGDFEKTRKENKKGGNKSILQHIGSTGLGFVNVITDKESFYKEITNVEYNHKKPVQNKYFRDVVLSQEMIDNFLKEQTAEVRYSKFVETFPEVSKYDNTYKNIISLLKRTSDETKRIEKEKKKNEAEQLDIDFDLEFKKFDQINEAILYLNNLNEKLVTIEKDSFNESFYNVLTSQVKSKLVSLDESLNKIKFRIDNIRLAVQGEESDKNSGLINFLENKKKLNGFEKTINELRKIISLIDNKDKTQNEINHIQANIDADKVLQRKFLEIEKIIETYLRLNNEVLNNEEKISNLNKNNIDIQNENTITNESTIKLKNKIDQLNDELKQTQSKLNDLPTQKKKLELEQKKLEPITKELNDISTSRAGSNRSLEALKLKIKQLNYYESRITDDIEILYELTEFKSQKKLILEIKKLQESVKKRNSDLLKIQEDINSQNQFNVELKDFVTNGLNIINRNNSSECPLCSQTYKSFEELSAKIIENKLLDIYLKEKLELKSKIQEEIKQNVGVLNSNVDKLKKQINGQIQPFKTDLLKLEKKLNQLSIQEQEKRIELEVIQNNLNEVNLFFDNEKNISIFEGNIKGKLEKIKKQISVINTKVNSDLSKLSDNQNLLKSKNKNIEILKNTISKIKDQEEFNKTKLFFNKVLNSNDITNDILTKEKKELDSKLSDLQTELSKKQNHLKGYITKLLSHSLSKEVYINKIEEVNKLKTLRLNIYESYDNFIRTEFGIDIKNKTKKQIEEDFDRLIQSEKDNQKETENKIERFKIIDILKDDCLKTTESKKILDDIEILGKKILDLRYVETLLVEEKDNLEIYLKKTIDEFFYTDLINAIYKKIDPHPDYSYIEFNCEFGDSKPRLQIYTNKTNVDGEIIKSVPVLYFSTAQINILSLSIFLARALKAKNPLTNEPIDCIFIDDPIQSMDSINILSFIDLFRGIITSLGKQLIVSTHEENFHLLLQKKIPKDLFKSKFIEFETFGKLKKEEVA